MVTWNVMILSFFHKQTTMATDREKLYKYFGNPFTDQKTIEKKFMVLMSLKKWPELPRKHIYVNRELVIPLTMVFDELQRTGLIKEIIEYNGCLNVRYIRGYEKEKIESIHAFAMAVDWNAKDNPLGGPVRFSEAFLNVWRKLGWICGADFKRLDGMHFQFTKDFTK